MPKMDMEELVTELTQCNLALWGACNWAGRRPARHLDHAAPGAAPNPPPVYSHHTPTGKNS